ncbi:cation diffusion facilitator family transporter [Halorhabdus rudnickae]|uniref:cation diffusion facilitator family transporter n=1 Tax=Halorhabdus rudnickae TaxID=1775544 RepID=UPI0010825AAA|nr:cation diffusion facilitator family transporter [Halorhabdus rudnickae]
MTRRGTLRRVGLLLFGANLLLFVLKGAVALETGSFAVESEAINSLADSVYSLVIVAGLYLTTQPPDFEHPHGHERIEPFVSLFVAVGIFAAGALVIYQSGTALLSGTVDPVESPTAIAVLLFSVVGKLALYRYCLRVGQEWQSPALVATALDNRNDVLTAGAALTGVFGASLGFPLLDPLAAMVVAVGILHTGVEVVRDNVNYLVGAAPPEELRAEIVQRALEHPEVKGAHEVIAHYVGPEIDVSLHVEVEGDRTLREAHDIETAVVRAVEDLETVDDAFVHVDPRELGEWKPDELVDRYAATGDAAGSDDESPTDET